MDKLGLFMASLWDQAANMGWYFLLAVALTALIKTYKLDKKIRHALERAGHFAIPLAVFAGLVSPLCSCGIMPIAASLLVAGVPLAPVMALMITSPVMSPDAFVLTWGVLDPAMAWGKFVGAAGMGLALGYLVHFMVRRGTLEPRLFLEKGKAPGHHCIDSEDLEDPRRGLTVEMPRARYFFLMVWDMVRLIGGFLVLAMVLESLLVTFVDPDIVRFLIGKPSWVSPVLATAVGIPLPLQQIAAVPILRGLLDLGTDPGAAMALLLAGPVTSIPAISFLSGLVDKKLLWLYMLTGLAGSLILGFAYLG